MKRLKYLVLIITLWIIPGFVYADIFTDSFDNKTKIDNSKTNVFIDTVAGFLSLPKNTMPNALAMKEFGYEYAVTVEDGVKFFSFDGNVMKENPYLSINSLTNPIGVALREDVKSVWVLTENELRRYDFDGNGMVYNPFLSISGLTNPISISSQPTEDLVAVLSKDTNGKGVVSYYGKDENGNITSIPNLSLNTNIDNPISISLVKNSYDLVISSKDGIYYYSFDGNSMVENPFLSLTGQSNIVSVMADDGQGMQYKVLREESSSMEVNTYLLTESNMTKADVLSKTGLTNSIALSLKLNSYDFGLLTETGQIQYYSFDGNSYVRNTFLEVTGLNIATKYKSPREYQSISFISSKSFDTAKLTVTEQVPPSTNITYYISTDSGSNWIQIIPDIWVDITLSNTIKIKAVFETSDFEVTPKLYNITLIVTRLDIKNLTVTNISLKYPQQVVPTSNFPVIVKAGCEVIFTLETEGYAKQVTAMLITGQVTNLIPSNDVINESNTWTGSFIIPVDIDDGNFIGITAVADRDGKQKSITENGFLIINGKAFYDLDLILVE